MDLNKEGGKMTKGVVEVASDNLPHPPVGAARFMVIIYQLLWASGIGLETLDATSLLAL